MGVTIENLYIHESVENVVPPEDFRAALDDIDVPVRLVGDGVAYTKGDGVATYEARSEFQNASWVHCIRAGYDDFDIEAYEEIGVPLTNSTGIHGATVGELAVGFVLAFARNLHRYRDQQDKRNWHTPEYSRPFTAENEKICVVGLGTIGKGIAKRADALGLDVVGVRRSQKKVPYVAEVFTSDEYHKAIEGARFVALAVPHTSETERMISEDEFKLMRNDAYLINVGRGAVVDEPALIDALRAGDIAGAALDVFEEEPLPEGSPLWEFDEVIISPHKGSATNRYHLDIADLVKENIRRIKNDERLKNRVA